LEIALPPRATPTGAEQESVAGHELLAKQEQAGWAEDEAPALDHLHQCRSRYFAVFDSDTGVRCVANTTTWPADWGPPTGSWFRSSGGELRAGPNDVVSLEECSCLAEQDGYRRPDGAGVLRPVEQIVYETQRTPIRKWVCGDRCVGQTGEKQHGF
jgi:hypothetical protein